MAISINESKQLDFDLNVEASDPNDEAAEVNAEAFDLNVEAIDLNPKAPNDNNSNESDSCIVCWDPMVHNTDDSPTPVTLKCGHKFHLPCIGSAFNKKNKMECPYCRQIEPGHWRIAKNHQIVEEDVVIPEENTNFGIFTNMVLGYDSCPFEDLQHHTHEVPTLLGPSILFHGPACQCLFVECSLAIPQLPSAAAEVTDNSDLSRQLTTGVEEVPDLNEVPVDPLLPCSDQSNRKTFWTMSEPGVIRGRHYLAHPSPDHSFPFERSGSSMNNAAMALPSSSMSIYYPNNNAMSSHLGESSSSSAPVSHDHVFPYGLEQLARGPSNSWSTSYGSNFVNQNGFNQLDIWERVPFLEPGQQQQIENEFYRIVYNGDDGNGDGDDGGSNSFGGGGNSGDNGISGGGTS